MGWCLSLLKVLLYTSATLGYVKQEEGLGQNSLKKLCIYHLLFRVLLTYFHIECQREKEAKAKDKFNEVYESDKTDIETNLPFLKKGTGAYDLFIGNFCAAIDLKSYCY